MYRSRSKSLRKKLSNLLKRSRLSGVAIMVLTVFCLASVVFFMDKLNIRYSRVWVAAPEDHTPVADADTSEVTLETVAEYQLWDKWIVITSIFSPSLDVAKLAAVDGWRLVVVGDLKTPANWRYPGVVYLGIEEQRNLSYRTANQLPFNSYTRKNIGYLYAIDHGAQYIYDTDDDNHPASEELGFQLAPSMTGLIYQDARYDVMNPYAHFGQASIWPRGYPLNAISRPPNYTYTLCAFETPSIQQGLVNRDPDVDAIFRLTRNRKSPGTGLNVTFDSRTPPVTLARGVYAPFNSQNTLFRYDAFWALFLPTTVSFRVTDIWRGYWAQRLMQLLGQQLAFFPPNAVQARNVHDYLDDFVQEIQMYVETEQLVSFLKQWQCSRQVYSLFECVLQLSEDMADARFWGEQEPLMVDAWLEDLKQVGYREPNLVRQTASSEMCLGETADVRTVYYAPVDQTDSPSSRRGRHQVSERADKLIEFCADYLLTNISSRYRAADANFRTTYDNILLIVVFNSDFFQVIPMLDNLYYDHFPNIAYCGETADYEHLSAKMAAADAHFAWIPRPGGVTFINITAASGYFSYECVVRAMDMNYAVDGYMVVGDDVLLSFWNLEFDVDYAAYEWDTYGSQPRYTSTAENDTWGFWATVVGYNNTNRALDELQSDYDRTQDPLLREFFANVDAKELNGTVGIDYSDIYYVPTAKARLFRRVIEVFLRNRSFVEIAVPTVIHGLHDIEINQLYGSSLEDNRRQNWTSSYNSSDVYLHPVKLSHVLASTEHRQSYCQTYVRDLLHNVYGLL